MTARLTDAERCQAGIWRGYRQWGEPGRCRNRAIEGRYCRRHQDLARAAIQPKREQKGTE